MLIDVHDNPEALCDFQITAVTETTVVIRFSHWGARIVFSRGDVFYCRHCHIKDRVLIFVLMLTYECVKRNKQHEKPVTVSFGEENCIHAKKSSGGKRENVFIFLFSCVWPRALVHKKSCCYRRAFIQ